MDFFDISFPLAFYTPFIGVQCESICERGRFGSDCQSICDCEHGSSCEPQSGKKNLTNFFEIKDSKHEGEISNHIYLCSKGSSKQKYAKPAF